MKDFKDYRQTAKDKVSGKANGGESGGEKLVREALAAYEGKDNAVLLADILRRAEEEKRAGRLSDGEIDAFYAQFAPLLNPFQRAKLQAVVDQLKMI